MPARSDRRAFPRRPFDAAVFTYENGARFVAHPIDLSLGGAFLATEAVDRIAMGDLVSVVFGPETGTQPAVHLFARVMRRQRGSGKGVGVAWEKAVTTGTPEHLAAFLERTFGVRAASAERKVATGEGRFRSMFSFEPIQQAARRHRETIDSILNAGEVTPPVQRVAAATAPRKPARFEIRPPEAAHDVQGVLTAEMITGGERAPVDLEGTLRLDGVVYEVRVVELGVGSLEVVTADPVPESPRPADVSLDILYLDQTITVTVRGPVTRTRRVVGTRGFSLDVSIRQVDDGAAPGAWLRYAKWCYFQSLSDAER